VDSNQLATIANVAQIASLSLQSIELAVRHREYVLSKLMRLFRGLQDSGVDLSAIGESEQLQSYFFKAVDEVAREANLEKIDHWKSAVIHLATDFKDYDFKDNLIRTLTDLTAFELTVLHHIYSTKFEREHRVENEVIEFFEGLGAPRPMVEQAIKRLASHALLVEEGSGSALGAGGNFHYRKNDLGPTFIRFISDEYPEH
jgi:hypothetical protein